MSDTRDRQDDVNGSKFARMFHQRVAEKSPPTVEKEFAGFHGIFRRMPISGWLKSGRVPQFLIHSLMKVRNNPQELEQLRDENLTPEQFDQSIKFQRDVVCSVCVNPKVVAEDRPLEGDEISYAELAENYPLAVDLIVAWVLAGSPDIPVKMDDGTEVTLTEVESFRHGTGGGEPTFAGTASDTFRAEQAGGD